MPDYKVTMRRRCIEEGTIVVKADDEDDAYDEALAAAADGSDDITWETVERDGDVEVEAVQIVSGPKEDNDEN
jgi:flavin-binding protein dodecin